MITHPSYLLSSTLLPPGYAVLSRWVSTRQERVPASIRTLMYHRVCADNEPITSRYAISRETFRKQMEFLSHHGFYTPRLTQLPHCAPVNTNQKHPIILTFDDGYLDNYENAFPVLQEFGFSAVIFLVPDFSRRVNWWDDPGRLGNVTLLQPEQIRRMCDAGIEFGAHSFSHRSLPYLNDRELDEELLKGRTVLENLLEHPPSAIAYPYGDVDDRVKHAARQAGYEYGFAAHTGPLRFYTDLFEIRRIIITNRSDTPYLNFKFFGVDHFIRWSLWRSKKMIGKEFKYHQESR